MIVKSEDLKRTANAKKALDTEDLYGRRIHFMGAGGIGVSALMELARSRGAIVSGCDCSSGGQVAHLQAMGVDVKAGHDPAHLGGVDELVYTPAISQDHPEIVRARELGLPASLRMEFLGRLMRGPRTIGVTGSHGKTTTTWMIAHLLIEAGRDPSVLVGGVVASLDSNVRLRQGGGDAMGGEMVVEVDESDNRLEQVVPVIPVVTNIDNDHLEHYGTIDVLEHSITRFLCSTAVTGGREPILIGCGDDERVLRALRAARAKTGLGILDYGFSKERAIQGLNIYSEGMRARFDCAGPFGLWPDLEMPVPGRHNIMNALAAIAVAWHLGIEEEQIRSGLASCERVGRRFEIKGQVNGIRIVDDYGHHPVEVAATVGIAKQSAKGRVGVLFQPHRYSRTAALGEDFARCFVDSKPDALWVLPVYAASEQVVEGGTARDLRERIRRAGFENVKVAETIEEAVGQASDWARSGDTLLVQGAGDVTRAADLLNQALL